MEFRRDGGYYKSFSLNPAVERASEWVRWADWQGANRSRYRGYREDLLSPPGSPPRPLWRAVRCHPFGEHPESGNILNSSDFSKNTSGQLPDLGSDVAVVGTGLVGAAAALGCAQLGLSVLWVGPALRPHQPTAQASFDARIYALAPSAIALAERLRVWSAVEGARTQAVTHMCIAGDQPGRTLDFDAYEAAVERLATIIEECALAHAFNATCAYTPTVRRCVAHLKDLAFHHSGVQLTLDEGVTHTAGLVIAADGARSFVRKAAGIEAQERAYDQTAVVANFAIDAPHHGTAWQWFTQDGVIALLPLPASQAAAHAVSLVWSAPTKTATELMALSAQDLADRVEATVHTASGQTAAPSGLRPLGAAASFALRTLKVAQMSAPRVVLVGDAAHVVHPLAGQGLNLGLQDVACLLDVLAAREPFRDIGDPTLLRRYARARAEAVALMHITTDRLARLFATDDPLIRWMRHAGLAFVDKIGPLKRALVRHALG